MGNGASHVGGSTITIDGEQIDTARLKALYPELRSDLKRKDELIAEKDEKIATFKEEITELKKEIRQLQSVLEATGASADPAVDDKDALPPTSPKSKFLQVATKVRNKRFAISAESGKNSTCEIKLEKFPKSPEVRAMIKEAVLGNNFLKHLEEPQVKEIILCMQLKTYQRNEYVIREGEPGSALFVVNKGTLEVQNSEGVLGMMSPGILFGELAVLYNCTRTASVRTMDEVEVWTLDRRLFQIVMKNTGTMRRNADYNFLKCVPSFKDFDAEKLYKLVEVAGEEYFTAGEYIVREGERG